ncbi:ABC-type antimicrobial peptide transport system, permease component [Owenweeksia hongkongensis DSM 17368]|uniref:ABC-type antimicrobial peptide transport system, permease component n=1 Tax=Owenweeksia hongkongensis (strain DSM 17368 / CIP 108786 / JCM 12287 / NRRL B-23963 / UST20020801) TaxID=926562 RepID=G8R7L4_OWEHD|nr:ABC transporter permease [Owenweeksia hongkongensis]AEV32367.1 ABC-type antimicrobial peptide transport system, permease component [Owenweeksia hongkongensis DSM 17368]
MSLINRERTLSNLRIAMNALWDNKVRSILTALGIIFGVAAVITMLAIGKGAQEEILSQIKLVGVNNIEIKPVVEQSEVEVGVEQGQENNKKFSKGLDLKDANSIQKVIPSVSNISPEIILDTYVINNGIQRTAKLIGVTPSFFEISNIGLRKGRMFTNYQLEHADAVCIIGSGIAKKFFTGGEALGKELKCGSQWLTVVGITEDIAVTQKAKENLGIRDYNMDIYTPINTMLVRYEDRGKLIADQGGNWDDEDENANTNFNYHQVDRMVVQVEESELLSSSAEIISRMLKRRHNDQVDFEIMIPEHLLQQQQKTKDIFNLVLSAIAGISLLVGGIGIMNIMLASVLERTREIGTRMAIGARKNDIISQFLFEALLISLSGGVIGIILGIAGSFSISQFSEIETIVSPFAILISFGVASATGLIFGISPARKAAMQNPVESLRYE